MAAKQSRRKPRRLHSSDDVARNDKSSEGDVGQSNFDRLPAFCGSRRFCAWVVLGAAILGGIGLRTYGVMGKRVLIHDEAISFLSATGHQGDYAKVCVKELSPYGRWVPVGEWKRFIRPEEKFCFQTIRRDLESYDIHPPLYFWLLHLWILLFGVHIWTGLTLNMVFALASTLAMFGLGYRVFRDRLWAAIATFIWSVSPVVMQSTFEARQYELFALCTILFVWQTVGLCDRERSLRAWRLVLFAATAAAGLLTHYQFPIVVAVCGLYALYHLLREDRRRLIVVSVSVLLGGFVFVLLNPGFWGAIQRAGAQNQTFDFAAFYDRIQLVKTCYTSFFFRAVALGRKWGIRLQLVILFFLTLVTLKTTVPYFTTRKVQLRKTHEDPRFVGFAMLYFFLSFAAVNIFLYVAFYSPRHAMAGKYPSMVWPFFAFAIVIAIRSFKEYGIRIALLILPVLCVNGFHGVLELNKLENMWPDAYEVIRRAKRVVVDNARRGTLPRIIWFLPDDMEILASNQEYLLDHPSLWARSLEKDDFFLTLSGARGSDDENTQLLTGYLYSSRELEWGNRFWNMSRMVLIGEPRTPGDPPSNAGDTNNEGTVQ